MVRLRTDRLPGCVYNEFEWPELSEPQRIREYVKNQNLSAGEVTVCAGVSGFQQALMSGKSSRIIVSGSIFDVRSLSLKKPLGTYFPLYLNAEE